MPNWCRNNVFFTGKEENIQKILDCFNELSEKCQQENSGQVPEFLLEDKTLNIRYFFDIYVEGEQVNYDTRWVQNTETLIAVCKHFNVGFEHWYEEIGTHLYGRTIYDEDGLDIVNLKEEDFEKVQYNEEKDVYYFEGKEYESDFEIYEILLERKIEKRLTFNLD